MAICYFRCVLLGFIFVLGSALLASNKAELDLNVTVHESVQAFESINGAALSAVNGFDVAFANMFVLSNEATGFNIKVSSSLNETCPDEDREIHMFCGSMGLNNDLKKIMIENNFHEGANNYPGEFVLEKAFVD